jgi:hypothetical protein
MWAIAMGRVMQSLPVLFTTSLIFTAGTTASALSLSSLSLPAGFSNVTSALGLGTAVLGGLLSLVVYNAPFNLVRVLNNTTSSLIHVTDNLKQENNELKTRVETLDRLSKGLKATSDNLLRMLTESAGNNVEAAKINAALNAVAEDIANGANQHMSQFMNQLLSMEHLQSQLDHTMSDLERITQSQEKMQFDGEMNDLVRWIDTKADGQGGTVGIRQALLDNTLTRAQMNDIYDFLIKIDHIIQLHDQTLQITRTVKGYTT